MKRLPLVLVALATLAGGLVFRASTRDEGPRVVPSSSPAVPTASPSPSAAPTPTPSPTPVPVPSSPAATPQAGPDRTEAPGVSRAVCGDSDARLAKTFRVLVDGSLPEDAAGFASELRSTFCDGRGWTRTGTVSFAYSPGGGVLIQLLSQPRAKARCERLLGERVSGRYSCASTAAQEIVLNWDRWSRGADGWSGPLREYRRMVANHEMGHVLDLRHQPCAANGATAPVMMQQSISMTQGGKTCVENPWPLDEEIARIPR